MILTTMRLVLVFWAAILVAPGSGYKILCVFPVPTQSHNILGKGIVTALLDAGHTVYWATPYPELVKKPLKNLKIIDVSATKAVFKDVKFHTAGMDEIIPLNIKIVSLAAQSPQMVVSMVSEQFDAVVTEWFVSDVPAGYAAVQQVPWIMLSSTSMSSSLEDLVDEVTSTVMVPVVFNRAVVPMNFWERSLNSLMVALIKDFSWALRTYHSSVYDDLFGPLAAARGTVLPPLSEVYNNVSVMLVNSHPTLAPAQSLPPNVVDIAGYHIEEDVSLPKDLKELLDASSEGFVYFSLGSVVQVSKFPAELKKDLLQMLGELPCTVLWKSDEELAGVPKNVHMRSWFPQPGILAHPNIKLFITHGGLLSTIEAVHYGVPLLAVPVFGDQPMNADRAVQAGYAVKVQFHDGMAQELRAGLKEMVSNDSYYKTVKHLSKLFHSRPVAPSKLISHYVELAIESKGAYHLRSAARHFNWYQRRRLDQLLACIVFIYSLYIACRIVVRQLKKLGGKRKKD